MDCHRRGCHYGHANHFSAHDSSTHVRLGLQPNSTGGKCPPPPFPYRCIFSLVYFQLEAIRQTKVNMTVTIGNYPVANDGGTAYQRQASEIQAALQIYGTSNVEGIQVGNEFILECVFTLDLFSSCPWS
jgi:hypothetical protein